MTPERLAIFERLSVATQERLMLLVQRIAEGYEGEIVLHVKKGGQGRSGISLIRWVQTDTFKDG